MSARTLERIRIFAVFLLVAGVFNALLSLYEHNQARETFVQRSPCPSTGREEGACPGWVIGYEVPLCSGGSENPDNMQWQPAVEADARARQRRQTFERGAVENMMRGRGGVNAAAAGQAACSFRVFAD